VDRTCTVPADTQLFFPVFNNIFVLTEVGETEQDARDFLNTFMDSVQNDSAFTRKVTVDGKEVQSKRIIRADSPLFTLDLPENNLFGLAAGEYDAVGTGLWATLPGLSEGEHTIHVVMTSSTFSQDITYHVTVE
jgi:hypothetical protein